MQHSQIDPPMAAGSNDYHVLPATEKQIRFAEQIAFRTKATLPDEIRSDRQQLSRWIDAHKDMAGASKFSNYPSSKQVAYAERVARLKRRVVPHACFHDRLLMSKWIDCNR